MGRDATKDEIKEILFWLGFQTTDQIQSKAGCLIDALQARALSDAPAIAAELTGDLDLFGTSETQSTISEIAQISSSFAPRRCCASAAPADSRPADSRGLNAFNGGTFTSPKAAGSQRSQWS